MRSEPVRQGGILFNFAGIHLGEMKIFHMKTRKWSARQGGTEFPLISFVFFCFFCLFVFSDII